MSSEIFSMLTVFTFALLSYQSPRESPTHSPLPQLCPHKIVSWAKIALYRILQLASAGPSSPVRWILSDD